MSKLSYIYDSKNISDLLFCRYFHKFNVFHCYLSTFPQIFVIYGKNLIIAKIITFIELLLSKFDDNI